jgi:hypothetical protein
MRSRFSTHMRARILQGQAALLALVFVASQLGSHLHAATEHHARCPEHGELVHVEMDAPLAAAAAAKTDGAASPEGAALRNGAAAEGHEHEHCYLCPVSRERLGTIPNTDTIAAAAPVAVASPQPAVVAHGGQPRYVLAPKTSPPL